MNMDPELDDWAREWRDEITGTGADGTFPAQHYGPSAFRLAPRFAMVILACLAIVGEVWGNHSLRGAAVWLIVTALWMLLRLQEWVTDACAGEPTEKYAGILSRSNWTLLLINSSGALASLGAGWYCALGGEFEGWLLLTLRGCMLALAVSSCVLFVKYAHRNMRLLYGMNMLRPRGSGISGNNPARVGERFGRLRKHKKRKGVM